MKEFINNLKFTWKYGKDQKKNLIILLINNIIIIFISVLTPIISARVIVNLTNNNLLQLIYMAFILFILNTLLALLRYIANNADQNFYTEAFTKLQTDLGKEILRVNNTSLDKQGTGVFVQRLTNDTSRMADIFGLLSWYLSSLITNIGIFFAIFMINKFVCLCIIIMTLVIYLIDKKNNGLYTENDKVYRKESDKTTGFVTEVVRGAKDIKMLSAENSFISVLHGKVKS